MSSLLYQHFDILTFVKSRIVHDNHTISRELRKSYLFYPAVKDIAVDATIIQSNSKQRVVHHSTNSIGLVFELPVVLT